MKHLLPLIATLALFTAACKKEKKPAPVELPVNKTVQFHVFAGRDYSDPIYREINAEVRLQIRKINYRTGEMQLVWDSTFAQRKLYEFPRYIDKIVIRKTFPVLDTQEKLNGGVSVKYTENSTIWQAGFSDEAMPGTPLLLLEMDL